MTDAADLVGRDLMEEFTERLCRGLLQVRQTNGFQQIGRWPGWPGQVPDGRAIGAGLRREVTNLLRPYALAQALGRNAKPETEPAVGPHEMVDDGKLGVDQR